MASCSGSGGIPWNCPRSTSFSRNPRRFWGRTCSINSVPNSRSVSICSTRWGGGNLSLQVHPFPAYAKRAFGLGDTQDENYYLLDAEPDGIVYLGLTENVDQAAFAADLRLAQQGGASFPAERHVNVFPARKHDHFLIPAGTVHGSGRRSMVLEISGTPYIFTFKLWDRGRLGMDGRPRPIHLDHGLANIAWDRRTAMVERELINDVEVIAQTSDYRIERTGLVPLDTTGSVNVLNLVEGDAAWVESPTEAFAPFRVAYAETFIVPAAVGAYTIRPDAERPASALGVIRARVRPQQ